MPKSPPENEVANLLKKSESMLTSECFTEWIDGVGAIGTDAAGGISRLAFSDADLEIRRRVMDHMRNELSLEVRIDAWGNIFGRRPGKNAELGSLATGSHLDTVRNGGRFDGAAGVFCGLEMVRLLNQLRIQTWHPFEVIVFTAEEANSSGISTIGSRGFTGRLQKEGLTRFADDQGVPLLDAIEKLGGDRTAMDRDRFQKGMIEAFIEIHNEQMPWLEQSGDNLGIVLGVTGIRRRRLTVDGSAGHGGTIPMDRRADALVAAADIIGSVRRIALESGGQSVATVGHIEVIPNSVNVVPGQAFLELEIRSYEPKEIDRIDQEVWEAALACQEKYGVLVHRSPANYDNAPRAFSPKIQKALHHSVDLYGYRCRDLVSMAGHDAYHLSTVTETGMVFVPSRDGKSHCPEEYTDPNDLVKATQVLTTTLLLLDMED